MPPKKKGPPYTDDPGCKYVVIEDPWPGNATGKARTQVFYNHLCTWVYFMLGKEHQPEAVYSVNTRGEVIVQLPQDVDLTPILGAHAWRKCLSRGNAQDKDRVSYVFEYNYRNRGEPGNRTDPPLTVPQWHHADAGNGADNWLETYPTVSGDPPPHLKFPVIYPYPRASYASPKGKNCADLALPLPPTRQPTPIPDTSLFEPYEHPSQISSRTVEGAHARPREDPRPAPTPPNAPSVTGKLGKMDPYDEETHNLRSLKQEVQGGQPPVKHESSNNRPKSDPDVRAVKPEPELYGPSKTFRNAVERLQQARAGGDVAPANPPHDGMDPRVKVDPVKDEPELYGPSKVFRTAVERLQHARSAATGREESSDSVVPTRPAVKAEQLSAPSEEFVAAFQRIRGSQFQSQEAPHIKQDFPEEPAPTPQEAFRAAFERLRGVQTANVESLDSTLRSEHDYMVQATLPEAPRPGIVTFTNKCL
ncbi:hypothetical protein BC628DRAFT_1419742 [Trametes gibbosa]|nr:hypothetical protein BC628DRAFT_1419742 [Trametes gibbosa]